MLIKLLPKVIFFWALILTSAMGWGQCPTSVSISADPGTTICAGTPVTFTANASGGGTHQYQWLINGNEVTGQTGSTFETSSLTNGQKVQVRVSSTTDNTTDCSKTSNEFVITVNPVQTPTVSINPTKTSICPGENITFQANNTYGGTNPQYAWYINSSSTVAKTGASATFSASDFPEGDNTVRVVLTSNFNCASSTTAEATSAAFELKPDATISSPTNKDQTVCIHEPIQNISFALGGGATNAAVTGLPPGVSGSKSGNNYVLSGSPTSKGIFPYTVTTTGTCAQTTATGTITVDPDATIALTSGNNTQTVCAAGGVADGSINPITYSIGETGTGATVTGLPTGIEGSFNNGVFTIKGSSSVSGTHNYSVKATGDCGDSAPLTGSIVITANKAPSVSITSSDSDNIICAGSSVTFTATPTNGGTNPSYQWKIDGANAGTNSSKFTTTTLTDGQDVTVVMTSSETCLTMATATSDPITITVNPNLTPEVTIEASDSDICPNDSVTFTATPVQGGSSPSYQWKVGSTNVGTNSPTFTTTSLTDGQSVSVVLTSNEACLEKTTATSNSIVTAVQPPAPATPGTIAGPSEVCNGSTNTFKISAINNADQYVWTLPDGSTETTEEPEVTFEMNRAGETTISVLAENTCYKSDSQSLAVTSVDGIPNTPGTIKSSLPETNKNICPPLDNLTFWLDEEVENAESYNWILPSPGWEIISGEGTKEITVRVTSATTNGSKEVKVEAVNICGNSETPSVYNGIVVDTHIIASVGEDQSVCKSESSISISGTRSFGTANLTTNFETSGTGTFSNLPSGNDKYGAFTINYAPSDEDRVAGEVKITINVPEPIKKDNTGNECGSATDEVYIYFKPDAKITPPADPNPVVCKNSAIPPLEFILEGTLSGATVTGLPADVTGNYSAGKFVISGTPSVAGTFNYTINTTGECTQTSATGTITVDELTTVEAGQAETDIVCQSATPTAITLTGASFGGGATSAAWTITSGGGSLSNTAQTATPENITYTPAASYTGDVVLTLTTNAPGKCAAVSATRTITVQPAPTVVAGTAATDIVCQSENPTAITLAGASFGGGATAAAWSIASGRGSLSSTALSANPETVTYTPAPGYTGDVILTLISDAPGVCSAVNDIRTITVEPAPTVDAGEAATDTVCQSANPAGITLTGASFGGGATSAAWSITKGEGTLNSDDRTENPENIIFTPQSNFTGEVELILTSYAPGTCSEITDTRIITVESAAVVEAGGVEGAEDGCQSATPGTITLSGATLGGGATTAAWSIVSGGGTLSSEAQTAEPEVVTYTPTPNFTGTIELKLTSAATETCEEVSDTRVIRISEALTIDAGADIDLCSGSEITLSDITLGSGVTAGSWEIISGQGTLSSTTETPNLETVTFTAPNQFKGETVLRLTSNNPEGLCEVIFDERTINIQQEVTITTPPVNLGICSTQDATFEVIATGDNLTYQWFFEGTTIQGATDANFTISQATSENAGSYTVQITGESSCGEPVVSEAVTLNIDEDIVIDTQPVGGNYCVGGSIPLSVEASADGAELSFEWFNASNESVGTGSSITIENAQISHSGQYYAIITGPAGFTCSTVTTGNATVVVNPAPVISSIGNAIEICSVGEEVNITAGVAVSHESSIEWSVSKEPGETGEVGTINKPTSLTDATYVPNGATGTVILSLTVQGLDGCSEITETKNITIIPQPELTGFSYTGDPADVSTEFCQTDVGVKSPEISGENLNAGTGVYSITSGTGLTVNEDTGDFTPNGTAPGEYVITYTFTATSNGACEPVTRDFKVVIGENPLATFSYDSEIYCKDTRYPEFNTAPVISFDEEDHENADSFEADKTGLSLDAATGAIDLTNSSAGTYIITRTVDYTGETEDGCQPVTADYTITVSERPIPDFTYSAAEFCSDPEVAETITPDMAAGAGKGTFSYTATPTSAVLDLDTVTGEIDIQASEEGTYVITNIVDTEGDGCEAVSDEFTITVDKLPSALFSYAGMSANRSFCISSLGASLETSPNTGGTYSISGPSTLVKVDSSTGQLTWTMAEGVAGNYSITYTIPAGTVCEEVTHSESVSIDALPVGGEVLFEGVGRVFMTCENAVEGYATTLKLTGATGQVVEWQYRTASGSWQTYNSQATELSSGEVENIVNNVTTVIRAKLVNGACNADAYSDTAIVSVIPSNIKPSPVKAEPTIVCFGDDISLSSEIGYDSSVSYFEGGDFTSSGIKNDGWNFTDPNGNEVDYNASANSGAPNHWHKTQPKWKFGTAAINSPYTVTEQWWNPLDDGKTNEHFAITQGTHSSNMDTPAFTLTGMDEAVVTFDQAFNLTTGATIRVVLLQNGTPIKDLYKKTGPETSGNYESFGNGTPDVNQMALDLGSYIGESNLKIRFEYTGARPGDIWAVDNIKVPEGPQGVLLQWFYDDDPNDTAVEQIGVDNQEVVSFTPQKIGWNDFEVKTALLLDSNGEACESVDNFERVRVFVFDTYETSVEVIPGECGNTFATLNASISGALQGDDLDPAEVTFDGYKGEWKIVGPDDVSYTLTSQNGESGLAPTHDPNVNFESERIGEFTITWELIPTSIYPEDYPDEELRGEIVQNPACPPEPTPVTLEFADCTTLDFDGTDDVVVIENGFTGAKAFEAWIRPVKAGGIIMATPTFEVTSPVYAADNLRWYHVAVIVEGTEQGVYIDGIKTNYTFTTHPNSGTRTSIGAKWTSADSEATAHFKGWIEEVKIWKNPPTLKEIRFMMNQRLKLDGEGPDAKIVTPLEGEIVPNKPVAGSYYTANGFNLDEDGDAFYNQTADDLLAYYRLISEVPDPDWGVIANTYKPINGNTPDLSFNDNAGRLYNMTTHQENTSPTPYFTAESGGDWFEPTTWARPGVWDHPYSTGIDSKTIEWNIAKVLHNVFSAQEVRVLGLVVSEAGTLDMQGTNPTKWETGEGGAGNPLYISHYLLLNGVIDLNGESQLLQPHGSLVDRASIGYLDRDQQGTASSYNYNYWSSPVSEPGADYNIEYTVGGVLMDGTTISNAQPITFKDLYAFADGSYTGDKRISSYWLFKFHGTANNYFSWEWIGAEIPIAVGEGWSMKGTLGGAAIPESQNYTFRGLPNNGDISPGSTGPEQNYLVGNPYPSAINAKKFIADNLAAGHPDDANIFNGTVYFWSHFANKTHYLEQYVGGYAAYNLSGGVRAVASDARINATEDEGGQIPQQFIPVGQAFFLTTVMDDALAEALAKAPIANNTVNGGEVIFKNSQRIYVEESEDNNGSIFHSADNKKNDLAFSSDDEVETEQSKIWLKFKSPLGYHRQILVTADENASDYFDLGYDAPLIEDNEEDMYWFFSDYEFVIQGVADFNLNRELQLGMKISKKGALTISIDELYNVPADMNIFLEDSLKQVVHDLREKDYHTTSEEGIFTDRFKIVFKDKTLIEPVEPPVIEIGDFEILYVNGTREILVRNPKLIQIKSIFLNNLMGQQIMKYYDIPVQEEVRLPVKRFSSGVYIIKVHSDNGISTKKIILE